MGWGRKQQLTNSKWKGYSSELFMKTIVCANDMQYSEDKSRRIIQELLFTLEPYYDSLLGNMKENITYMISTRQMCTFRAFMFHIREHNVTEAIHELTDFVHNYGLYKKHELSELETYLIYIGLQQIEMLFIQDGKC